MRQAPQSLRQFQRGCQTKAMTGQVFRTVQLVEIKRHPVSRGKYRCLCGIDQNRFYVPLKPIDQIRAWPIQCYQLYIFWQ
jgi:hypothetical protein